MSAGKLRYAPSDRATAKGGMDQAGRQKVGVGLIDTGYAPVYNYTYEHIYIYTYIFMYVCMHACMYVCIARYMMCMYSNFLHRLPGAHSPIVAIYVVRRTPWS